MAIVLIPIIVAAAASAAGASGLTAYLIRRFRNQRQPQATALEEPEPRTTRLQTTRLQITRPQTTPLQEPDEDELENENIWMPKKEDVDNMRNLIKSQKPFGTAENYRIVVFGQIGVGKSSCFNTANSALTGIVNDIAEVRHDTNTNVTTVYRVRKLENTCIYIGDTMGFNGNEGMHKDDIAMTIKGHVPNKYEYNLRDPISSRINGYIANPTEADKIQVVVIVIDANIFKNLPEENIQFLKNVCVSNLKENVPVVVLVTKLDEFSRLIKADVLNAYRSKNVKKLFRQIRAKLGVDEKWIFPVVNYQTLETNWKIDWMVLKALEAIIRRADGYLQNLSS